jgi:hypothetical protein
MRDYVNQMIDSAWRLPPIILVLDLFATRRGSGGRRRSPDAELWRPCEPDVARGNRGRVGSGSTELAEVLALPRGMGVPPVTFADARPGYAYVTRQYRLEAYVARPLQC